MLSFKSISFVFFFRILNIFNTHTQEEERNFFKETYSGAYQNEPNSWIHSTYKKIKKEGALVLVVLKNLTFNNSKSYFIYFNTSLYNTLNINDSIFFTTFLKYYFFIHFLFFFRASFSLFLSISLSLIWRFWRITSKATATSIVTYNLQPPPLLIAKP